MKYIFTLYTFLYLTTSLFAQKIHITDSANTWIYNYSNKNLDIIRYKYYLKDTLAVIGSLEYKYMTADILYTNAAGTKGKQSFYFREDTSGKIYLRINNPNLPNPSDSSEIVLFDYSLNNGDIYTVIRGTDTIRHKVNSIGTVIIANNSYRYFEMHPLNAGDYRYYYFIEGIGCTESPLFPLNPIYNESSTILFCFSTNGTTPPFSKKVHFIDNTSSCLVNISEKIKLTDSTIIYPQPATNNVNIELAQPISGTLCIYNTLGQKVATQAIKHERTIHFENQLNLHGLYYYRITTDNGSAISGKIIFR